MQKKGTNTKCSSFYLSVITAGKPFLKLSRRQRLVKHKALNGITANFSEIVKLLLSFNSLGDSFLAKLFNHFYNVIEHYKIFILALIILFKRNKGLVYLYSCRSTFFIILSDEKPVPKSSIDVTIPLALRPFTISVISSKF